MVNNERIETSRGSWKKLNLNTCIAQSNNPHCYLTQMFDWAVGVIISLVNPEIQTAISFRRVNSMDKAFLKFEPLSLLNP